MHEKPQANFPSFPSTHLNPNYHSQAKIAVKAQSTAEILELQARARQLDLCAQVISDAGRTQIAAGSKTVLGIGP